VPAADLDEAALVAWGGDFVRSLTLPACVALHGDLGSGKTTLARAMARAMGFLEPVTSPTYALVHEYHSPRGPVHHLDLYRIEGPHQLPQLGWEEMLRTKGLILVEWAERAGLELPKGTHHLRLEHLPEQPGLRRLSW
jgi:tRNA threonylcarbamoyladenosine biosynthesis protein TsaE